MSNNISNLVSEKRNQEIYLLNQKSRKKNPNLNINSERCFLKTLENVGKQIKNFCDRDNLDLTDFLQSIAIQINESLEIERVEIIENNSIVGQKKWATVEKRTEDINSYLSLPINVGLREWGYIAIESSRSQLILLDNELSFLNQLVLYIEIAIQGKKIKQKLQEETNQRKLIESTIQELATNNDRFTTSCDLEGRLKLQQQVSNLKNQKSKLEIENTKSKLLADLTYKIRNSLNLDEILETTVSEIQNSLKLDRIVIYKILPGGSGKVVTESLVPGYPSVLGVDFPEETMPLSCQGKLSQQGYKAITDVKGEYQSKYPCLVEFLEGWGVKSKIIVPIIYDTNLWGFSIAHQCSYHRQWTEFEIDLFCQLTDRLAIAIKQCEIHHQLEIKLEEQKDTQNKLTNSLQQKEILLKEIHHRVKNNLNIISSMLNLQTNYIDDREIVNMFVDSQTRIRSIALIHEQLYNSDDLSQINFADYIENLVNNFSNIYNAESRNINFEINSIPLKLNLETAIPCGLLMSEIVTNSFKHAFPDNRSGTIKINLSSDGVLHKLDIRDNGIGLPKDFDWENSASLGLRLVDLLSMQLDGDLESHNISEGAAFTLTFEEVEYENRF